MSAFFDEGAALYARQPELMLAEVWLAAALFVVHHGDALEFVEGFKAARRRWEEFIAERGTP